jgi:hypothetical protein
MQLRGGLLLEGGSAPDGGRARPDLRVPARAKGEAPIMIAQPRMDTNEHESAVPDFDSSAQRGCSVLAGGRISSVDAPASDDSPARRLLFQCVIAEAVPKFVPIRNAFHKSFRRLRKLPCVSNFRHSVFGFPSDFEIRISDLIAVPPRCVHSWF